MTTHPDASQSLSERSTIAEPPLSIYSTKQAARLLRVSHRTLEDWRCRGEGPRFITLGRLVRYRLTDLHRFVNGTDFGNTAEAQAA